MPEPLITRLIVLPPSWIEPLNIVVPPLGLSVNVSAHGVAAGHHAVGVDPVVGHAGI